MDIQTPSVNPLNENHLADINQALAHIDIIRRSIDLAKRAGVDVREHEKQLADNEQKLRAIKAAYFPNR
jgi:hypothetical protein